MSYHLIRRTLTDRRYSLNRTQMEVAEAMGTTQSALSDLEAGRTKDPGLNTVARWAAALDLVMTVQFAGSRVVTIPVSPRAGDGRARQGGVAAMHSSELEREA